MIKLEKDEEIIKIIRKHWLPFTFQLVMMCIMMIIPPFIFELFRNFLFSDLTLHNEYLLSFLYIVFLISMWISLFISFVNYYLDIWILTNKRLVDVEQISFFSRTTSEVRLNNIQDVEVKVFGFINTMLKIGDVIVQNASSGEGFTIRQVGNPEYVREIVMEAYHKDESKARVVIVENEKK